MAGRDNKDKLRAAAIIDENLKRVYSDLVQEELPEKFKDLLAVLKAQDVAKKPKS